MSSSPLSLEASALRRKHVLFGWWCLAVFLAMGLVLDALHAFKVGGYLDVGNETRRLMWTLAHAHGTLLGLVHLAFACTAFDGAVPDLEVETWQRRASMLLVVGTVLLPLGFVLGGLWFYGGDPGLGAFLVPVGALALLAAVTLTAIGLHRRLG
jgi:hypothetical protein